MLVMPAALAFFRQAAPRVGVEVDDHQDLDALVDHGVADRAELRGVAGRVLDVGVDAGGVECLLKAGRSLVSQRGEVVASGRITPTLPVAAALDPVAPGVELEELELPQAASRSDSAATPAAAR